MGDSENGGVSSQTEDVGVQGSSFLASYHPGARSATASTTPSGLQQSLTTSGIFAAYPGDSTYSAAAKAYNLRYTLSPTAVAFPTSAAGGHSYIANGLGGNNGVLVVNLSNMKAISVHAANNTACIVWGSTTLPSLSRPIALFAVRSRGRPALYVVIGIGTAEGDPRVDRAIGRESEGRVVEPQTMHAVKGEQDGRRSTTGTMPADPRATPYLPSPSIIPLAPPATPSAILLPLDRAHCLGFYHSALTLSPYRSVRPRVSLGCPYPYTPPNENSGSLMEAQGENDVPLKGWRTEVES
ncbi:hypothetical protein B0H14DRAFT_2658473 [Mycena olivaceomarginata]|nr:hypothetical protein B0H14DRAFT_2658473 [Mycena olivaceomarginata]